MLYLIVYICFLGIYIAMPLPIQLIMIIINMIMLDPIPVVDEVIMLVSVLNKLTFLMDIIDFLSEHKVLVAILGIIIVFGLVMLFR